jgi:hypothetical protein
MNVMYIFGKVINLCNYYDYFNISWQKWGEYTEYTIQRATIRNRQSHKVTSRVECWLFNWRRREKEKEKQIKVAYVAVFGKMRWDVKVCTYFVSCHWRRSANEKENERKMRAQAQFFELRKEKGEKLMKMKRKMGGDSRLVLFAQN